MQQAAPAAAELRRRVDGGRFDFDDGGAYCGGWDDGKAHGHGVCTGPKGQGAYSGSWHYGFEVSGVYAWPSGSSFEGQWQNGKRHGLGVETRGRWLYRGEWTQGFKGRYGVRQSATSNAKYEGTWANGLQDGYGSETYADGGTYQGQWLRGMRHGYGVRASAPFGLASHYRPGRALRASLTSLRSGENAAAGREAPTPDPAEKRNHRVDDSRGGFVLKARSDEPPPRRNSLVEKTKKGILSGLKIRKQRSTGDLEKRGTGGSGSIRSAGSSTSWVSSESAHSGVTNTSLHTDSNASFIVEDEHLDASVTETYMGEWKNDKRTGFGVSERSDGLRYEGEWFANRKYGYGVTTFRDGTKEEGKYKNNVLITSQKRKHLFLIRSAKFRERIDAAVNAAQRASKIALQKADIAISRTATARGKAEQADLAADQAKEDCELAQMTARQFAPDFKLPNLEKIRLREKYRSPTDMTQIPKPILQPTKPADPLSTTQIPNQLPQQTPQQNKNTVTSSMRRPSEAYPQNVQPNDSKIPTSAYASSNLVTNQNQNQPISLTQQHTNIPQNNYQQSFDYQQSYQNQSYQAQQQTLQQQQQQQTMSTINNNYQPPTIPQQQNVSPYQQVDNNAYQQQNPYSNPQQQQNPYSNPQQQQSNANMGSPSGNFNQTIPNQNLNYNQSIQNQNLNYNQPQQNPYGPQQQFQQQSYQQQNVPNPNQYQNYGKIPQDPIQDPYMNRMDHNRIPTMMGTQLPGSVATQQGQAAGNAQMYNQAQRRTSRQVGDRPPLVNQSSIDHFDHYKRPPSRDSSVDRYAKVTGRMSLTGSRQPSVDKTAVETPDRAARGQSQLRSGTPVPQTGNGMVLTGRGSGATTPVYSVQSQQPDSNLPFEEILLRKRNLGQDIIPSLNQPKRTESLYVGSKVAPPATAVGSGGGGGGGGMRKMAAAPQPIQRKKSLPDVQGLPKATDPMSREEVSMLGSARREELRRMADESERLRANPLLYLVSPQVKDWFSRQQLVLLVLFVNISLAIMFFKLLT